MLFVGYFHVIASKFEIKKIWKWTWLFEATNKDGFDKFFSFLIDISEYFLHRQKQNIEYWIYLKSVQRFRAMESISMTE